MEQKKVFISYSWSPTTNRQWVKQFAERLFSDGVKVILDIWDLKEGDEKFYFMERMVNDPEIGKVLLICNKEYSLKANSKKGGVGTESMIVSGELYDKVEQNKFLPIVTEFDENNTPYLPTFLKSRIYIDLSSEEYFEEEYEKLIRRIFNKPVNKRPSLGVPPAYLLIEDSIVVRTTHKIKPIKNALLGNKENQQIFQNDYFDTLLLALDDHIIEDKTTKSISDSDLDDEYILEIERMRPLRDNYLEFLTTVFKYSTQINSDRFHLLFENLGNYINDYKKRSFKLNNTILVGGHIEFFIHEIFLYTCALAHKHQKYNLVAKLVNYPYFLIDPYDDKPKDFSFFNFYSQLFEYRKSRLRSNRIDLFADIFKRRVMNEVISFAEIQDIDILLYYNTCLNLDRQTSYDYPYWVPNLAVYRIYNSKLFYNKLMSKSYFDKIKSILNINSKSELVEKAEELKSKNIGLDSFNYRNVPNIWSGLNIESIATLR